MFRDESVKSVGSVCSGGAGGAGERAMRKHGSAREYENGSARELELDSMRANEQERGRASYREIDRALRRIARAKAGMDAEEAVWLRRAEYDNAWRQLGYAHALEYLEEVFGYSPRVANQPRPAARHPGELPPTRERSR